MCYKSDFTDDIQKFSLLCKVAFVTKNVQTHGSSWLDTLKNEGFLLFLTI